MRYFIRGLIIKSSFLLLLGVTACSDSNDALTHYGPPEETLKLYKSKCEVCHGSKGLADGKASIAVKGSIKSFTAVIDPSKAAIKNTILYGKGKMPAWGEHLSDTQVISLTDYILYLSK